MLKYTTEQLISTVERRAALQPVETEGQTKDDIVSYLNEEMSTTILPELLRFQEDYLTITETLPLTSGTSHCRIPVRAVGNTLRDVVWVSSDDRRSFLSHLPREERMFYHASRGATSPSPFGFFVEGDYLVLLPAADGGSLEMAYRFRPGQLVRSTAYRQVESVDSSTQVTLDSAPPASWVDKVEMDVHGEDSGASIHSFSNALNGNPSGSVLTFSTAIDGTADSSKPVAVGDYVCLAEEAAVPALPRELHPALAQAAVARMVEAEGDTEAFRMHASSLGKMLQDFKFIVGRRVDGKPLKVGTRNSFYRRQGAAWRRSF
tara:strand:+ start:5914 stop:6870 length:957 start_codon:yes stop_codon:yes gene_type:complete